jgi:hypothetical protein
VPPPDNPEVANTL